MAETPATMQENEERVRQRLGALFALGVVGTLDKQECSLNEAGAVCGQCIRSGAVTLEALRMLKYWTPSGASAQDYLRRLYRFSGYDGIPTGK